MSEDWELKICCMGAGYVGGPTMAVIAKQCPKVSQSIARAFMNGSQAKDENTASFPNSDDLSSEDILDILPLFNPSSFICAERNPSSSIPVI
jgi:hypothetical protein